MRWWPRSFRAARCVGRAIVFPPRGGQHNQWYQCDQCQTALRTLDGIHHQCPRCNVIYTGEPYDDVIFARRHNEILRNLESAAWAYAITRNQKYAQYARAVLLGYAERYSSYPYHDANRKTGKSASASGGHLFEQTLNEAACLAGEIGPAYDLVYDSGVFCPTDHDKIRTGLLLPMLGNIDKHKAGKGNWQTWHNAAMFAAAPLVGDVEWARKAIGQPGNGFVHQMEVSVSKDGLWYENSWGYHFYTLRAMVHIVEGAQHLGIDLEPFRAEEDVHPAGRLRHARWLPAALRRRRSHDDRPSLGIPRIRLARLSRSGDASVFAVAADLGFRDAWTEGRGTAAGEGAGDLHLPGVWPRRASRRRACRPRGGNGLRSLRRVPRALRQAKLRVLRFRARTRRRSRPGQEPGVPSAGPPRLVQGHAQPQCGLG